MIFTVIPGERAQRVREGDPGASARCERSMDSLPLALLTQCSAGNDKHIAGTP